MLTAVSLLPCRSALTHHCTWLVFSSVQTLVIFSGNFGEFPGAPFDNTTYFILLSYTYISFLSLSHFHFLTYILYSILLTIFALISYYSLFYLYYNTLYILFIT